MKLIVGGVRGTNPVAQPDYMKYGGETTSLLVEAQGGERVLIDGGTGVRALGDRLAANPELHSVLLLMTHYHLDHIVGLPSLGLIYGEGWDIRIAAPPHNDLDVETMLNRIMDKPFWPLQLSDLHARIRFDLLDGSSSAAPLIWGGLELRWCPLRHPGGCTAYRIDEVATGHSLVVATDVEWAASSAEEKVMLLNLCQHPRPVDLLLMDAQYEPAEYEAHRGWGHSTWADVLELAASVGASQVRLIHHDPRKNDEVLDRLNAMITTLRPTASLARANEEIDLAFSG